MDYQHLTDEELIHYALLDAQPGTLAGVLAQRYADNVVNVAELEESQREELEELEGDSTKLSMRIEDLEAQLDKALLA
jgi:cell division protein FtsB